MHSGRKTLKVRHRAETTFFCNPSTGMCHCTSLTSQIPHHQVANIYQGIGSFVSNPLKHPDPDKIKYIEPAHAIPDPLGFESAESYQRAIKSLADGYPDSFYHYALYAFRMLDVPDIEVYLRAALRDYNAGQLAKRIVTLKDALDIVAKVKGTRSIFGTRERIAMPDETLYFDTGTDHDRALLFYTLLCRSPIADPEIKLSLDGDIPKVFTNLSGSISLNETRGFPNSMSPTINELVVYVPAEDFEVSKSFYLALGFQLTEGWGGTMDCRLGNAVFRLQQLLRQGLGKQFHDEARCGRR